MGRLSFQVAGESHGLGLVAILTGLPRGIPFDHDLLQHWLHLRRATGGRGPRAAKEPDKYQTLAGISGGATNGGPFACFIPNLDTRGHSSDVDGNRLALNYPRPGHADLAGALKWKLTDATDVAEMASARITVAYVVVGSVCQMLLARLGIATLAHVVSIGKPPPKTRNWTSGVDLARYVKRAEESNLLALSVAGERAMARRIAEARGRGDTLGGTFEVVAAPVPVGLGSSQPLEARFDSRAATLLMGIPGVRSVAVGSGFHGASRPGSAYHDTIESDPVIGYLRGSNRAGGLEGGMTNGEPLVFQGQIKPIPSLAEPLDSASLVDGAPGKAPPVRSDVCVAPAAAIVARALTAYLLADEVLAHTGGSVLDDVVTRIK